MTTAGAQRLSPMIGDENVFEEYYRYTCDHTRDRNAVPGAMFASIRLDFRLLA